MSRDERLARCFAKCAFSFYFNFSLPVYNERTVAMPLQVRVLCFFSTATALQRHPSTLVFVAITQIENGQGIQSSTKTRGDPPRPTVFSLSKQCWRPVFNKGRAAPFQHSTGSGGSIRSISTAQHDPVTDVVPVSSWKDFHCCDPQSGSLIAGQCADS